MANSNSIAKNEVKEIAETGESNPLFNEPLTIFPNPFTNSLVLKYSGKENGRGTIRLYSSEMRLIATYLYKKTSRNLYKEITVHGLTPGVYFVQLNLGTTKIMKRLLKM
ncbi:MAG: T9SS type A sorting domain-containing protein [Ginsengibacter sp.]